MILTQKLFVRGESGLTKSERFVWIARGQQQPGKIAARVIGVRVRRAKRLLKDRQRALIERPCPGEVALSEKQAARLLKLCAVSGCSGPSAFSRIASARS